MSTAHTAVTTNAQVRANAPKALPTKKIRRTDLAFILRNLSTLVENGVSLPKALATLVREKSLRKHAPVLEAIRRKVEVGESFSNALGSFPETFGHVMVGQIRVAERAGNLAHTLGQVADQAEKANQLKALIIKKLSYPTLLVVVGSGVVTFMLMCVVPVFEKTYADAKVPLPSVTLALIAVGHVASSYYWLVLLVVIGGFFTLRQLRRNANLAAQMDEHLLRVPLVGPWLRDLAVLQLMDVLGNLMESGFRLADALHVCAQSVHNRAVRRGVLELEAAVQRGERFSREIDRMGDMFPPVVSQLVIIGEQTGGMAKSTAYIRAHLRREIERKTNLMVGAIEPILTISLAASIGFILLAIYLPMFDMIGTTK